MPTILYTKESEKSAERSEADLKTPDPPAERAAAALGITDPTGNPGDEEAMNVANRTATKEPHESENN